MRKFLFLIVLLLVGVVVISSFSELQGIVQTLKQAELRFLVVAILLQLIWFVGVAAVYKSLYNLMSIKEGIPHLALLASAVNFINIVAPSAGMGGMAVFIDDAGRRGHPHGRVVAAAALFVFLDYISFLMVLALGLLVLFRRNTLNSAEIIPTLILLAVVIFSGWLLYTGAKSPSSLGTTLAGISRGLNRVIKLVTRRDYFHEESSYIFAAEISDGLSTLRQEYRGLLWPMFYLCLNRILQLGILAMAFLSFGVSFTGGTLIGGYSVGYLIAIVSPTPSGVGIVEGAFPVVLASLGVPLAQAIIVTLSFRAVTFWLPLALGGITFRFINSRKQVAGLPD